MGSKQYQPYRYSDSLTGPPAPAPLSCDDSPLPLSLSLSLPLLLLSLLLLLRRRFLCFLSRELFLSFLSFFCSKAKQKGSDGVESQIQPLLKLQPHAQKV